MEEEDKYRQHAHIPIPTYDEAISRPSSSRNRTGPQEVSDDAERQGLMGHDAPRSTYRPPTVESPRASEDSEDDLQLPEVTGDGVDDRRRIEELDYLDPSASDSAQSRSLYHRPRLRTKLGALFSSIRLPSFRSLYTPVATNTSLDSPPPSRFGWLRRPFSRLPSVPDRLRISMPTAARLFGLLTIGVLIWSLFALDVFSGSGRPMAVRYDPESVRSFVQEHVDAANIAGYLRHITMFDHVAGTEGDLYMAEWMRERWVADGRMDSAALTPYYVYLNYPKPDGSGRSVRIVEGEGEGWEAELEEPSLDLQRAQSRAWHGYSRSGEAQGHLIFANGGSREDFEWLKDQGIDLNGSIALMRYYGSQSDRALKIKAAEEAGCVGALIYSDPREDGAAKGNVWPGGPWRPDDSLQRGGVAMTSWVVGDPLTPGYASTKEAAPIPREGNPGLVGIPSLPLAWRDAKHLIRSVKGGAKLPDDWIGGTPGWRPDWHSGTSGSDAAIVRMENSLDENDKQQIWNLHGIIYGQESPQKRVVVGNHRDAWCFGSVDPGSGSAIMMELVSVFGLLQERGWRPLRTIEFASWDAEEYNMVGSTEHVEDHIEEIRDNAYAYLNVDVGVYGPDAFFRAAGSPVWQKTLLHVLNRVSAPGTNNTLKEIWEQRGSQIEGLGAGSDYVAFQDMAGVSSIDFGFEGAEYGYPYHSCYETMDWMERFGDPDFEYHKALAQIWALLILEVADRPLVPLDLRAYAEAIKGPFLDNLQQYADEIHAQDVDLAPLRDAAQAFEDHALDFHMFEDEWTTHVLGSGGIETRSYALQRLDYNDAISNFERDLLDLPVDGDDTEQHGLPGREQYKHIIFGPQAWGGYDVAYFPFVRDALERGDWEEANRMVQKSAAILERATGNLALNS